LAKANLPGLMSLSPTNSSMSGYCSTSRFPQKEMPRTPVPTKTTLILFFMPKACVENGIAAPAASMLLDDRKERRARVLYFYFVFFFKMFVIFEMREQSIAY